MIGVNKVILIGNTGEAPDIRQAQSGKTVAKISLATNDRWKDARTGEQVTRTEWHQVVVFDKLAEIVREYVKKGDLLYIEGKLQTTMYKDKKTGQDRYMTQIIVSGIGGKLNILTSREKNGNGTHSRAGNEYANTKNQPPSGSVPGQMDGFNDDIPF